MGKRIVISNVLMLIGLMLAWQCRAEKRCDTLSCGGYSIVMELPVPKPTMLMMFRHEADKPDEKSMVYINPADSAQIEVSNGETLSVPVVDLSSRKNKLTGKANFCGQVQEYRGYRSEERGRLYFREIVFGKISIMYSRVPEQSKGEYDRVFDNIVIFKNEK